MLLQELARPRLFDAFSQMEKLQSYINRLVENQQTTFEFPPLNIWSSENGAHITCEIPGIKSEDIDISVANDTLTIKGSRNAERLSEEETYHRQERNFGQFARTIQLPFSINATQVKADFLNGILQIDLPRAEEDKPKKITVQSQ
jgi:HSP20 family protein